MGRWAWAATLASALVLWPIGGSAVEPAAAAPRAADVYGDDAGDRYVGTGGVLLPGAVGEVDRRRAAECPDCQWRLSTPCVLPDRGTPFPGSPACLSVTRGCGVDREFLRAWLRRPGQDWRELGLVCLPAGGPMTIAELGSGARARAERDLPPLHPAVDPPSGILTGLPAVFRSGQPTGPLRMSAQLAGEDVVVTARVRWTWRFGDGAELEASVPGGRYPDMAVAHTYRRAGRVTVRAAATWTATFTVDGLGPFPVPGTLDQAARLEIEVGEGRAVLVPRTRGAKSTPGMEY